MSRLEEKGLAQLFKDVVHSINPFCVSPRVALEQNIDMGLWP